MNKRDIMKILNKAKLNNLSTEDLANVIKDVFEDKTQELMEEVKILRDKFKEVEISLGEQLYESYPMYLSNSINGMNVPARGIGGNSIQELWDRYSKDIKGDTTKHNEIIALLTWGEKHKQIKVNFANFVISKDYERLELERNRGKSISNDII